MLTFKFLHSIGDRFYNNFLQLAKLDLGLPVIYMNYVIWKLLSFRIVFWECYIVQVAKLLDGLKNWHTEIELYSPMIYRYILYHEKCKSYLRVINVELFVRE